MAHYRRHHCGYLVSIGFQPSWTGGSMVTSLQPGSTRELKTGRPLLAICGGHQMLASQFGDGQLAGREEGTLARTYNVELTELGKRHPLFTGMPENPCFHFANYLQIIPSAGQTPGVLSVQEGSPAIALEHGGNWFSCQFHPESRKDSWGICYGELESNYSSNNSTEHHGQQLLENFFKLSAIKDEMSQT